MKRNINSLVGFSVKATDGEIGETEDFYFDDETWTIRYLIIKTGNWLSQRKVLIPFATLLSSKYVHGQFDINLTMDQIKNSPDIDTDKPVSRQQEAMLNSHHFLGIYWGGGTYGGSMAPGNPPHQTLKESEKVPGEDIHLRSALDVSGYRIHALDGEIGHINDFIVDDETWQLLYFVVDTHDFIGGKKVLIDANKVNTISFHNFEVFVDLKMDAIENSQLFEEANYNK